MAFGPGTDRAEAGKQMHVPTMYQLDIPLIPPWVTFSEGKIYEIMIQSETTWPALIKTHYV